MKKSNNYRLLLLRNILFNETDEENELNIDEIKAKLFKVLKTENLDNRTIRNDLKSLQEMDFEIVLNRKKYGRIYYSHQDKLFETYQIRLLVDAILSARFITKNEKLILINKLKQLTSVQIGETLPETMYFNQTHNLNFELIKLTIDKIHHAIAERKVLTYQYGDFNVEKEFILRHDGLVYHVDPYALVWESDKYYLVAYSKKDEEIRHYRLDRMHNIKRISECFEMDENFDLQRHMEGSLNMFGGEQIELKLRVENSLYNVMLDRFGFNVRMRACGESHFTIETNARDSDGLVNWILGFGSKVEVIYPAGLKGKVRENVNALYEMYE